MANSLAHSKWVCKYHVVFTPKYRRKIDYWGMREDIRDIIRDLCKWKGVVIIEGKVMPDHIHLLLSIPPKYSVSSFMGYLKGKSAMMIFERHANLKYKFGNRHFWATGYYVALWVSRKRPYGSISRSKRNRIRLRIKSAPRSTKTLLRVKRGNQSTMA